MSLFICAICEKKKDSDLAEMHPVSRNKHICDDCHLHNIDAQEYVARYEDQESDRRAEELISEDYS